MKGYESYENSHYWARGFIGKNLVAELKNRGYEEIYECNKDTGKEAIG